VLREWYAPAVGAQAAGAPESADVPEVDPEAPEAGQEAGPGAGPSPADDGPGGQDEAAPSPPARPWRRRVMVAAVAGAGVAGLLTGGLGVGLLACGLTACAVAGLHPLEPDPGPGGYPDGPGHGPEAWADAVAEPRPARRPVAQAGQRQDGRRRAWRRAGMVAAGSGACLAAGASVLGTAVLVGLGALAWKAFGALRRRVGRGRRLRRR